MGLFTETTNRNSLKNQSAKSAVQSKASTKPEISGLRSVSLRSLICYRYNDAAVAEESFVDDTVETSSDTLSVSKENRLAKKAGILADSNYVFAGFEVEWGTPKSIKINKNNTVDAHYNSKVTIY
jgi:hypothetical protein